MAASDEQKSRRALLKKWSPLGKKEKSLFIKLAVCLGIGILLMSWGGGRQAADTAAQPEEGNPLPAAENYAGSEQQLEAKLAEILAAIKGAGQVSVAITFEQGPEYVYARENSEKQSAEANESSSSLVQVDDSPVLLKQRLPEVKGVVIVAEGAGDALVKEQLYQAAKSLLGVTAAQIAVIEGQPPAASAGSTAETQ